MSSSMTPLAYLGGAIFQVARAHTALLWRLILGSFAVLGITTLKADSLPWSGALSWRCGGSA